MIGGLVVLGEQQLVDLVVIDDNSGLDERIQDGLGPVVDVIGPSRGGIEVKLNADRAAKYSLLCGLGDHDPGCRLIKFLARIT